MNPPTVSVRAGSPTEAEAAAIEAAIVRLWREDLAAAETGLDPWTEAARAEATGRAPGVRGPGAWRRSRWFIEPETRIGTGRGDAK